MLVIVSYFLLAIAEVLDTVLGLFMWIVIIRAILSWINPDPFNPLVKIIRKITDPPILFVRSKIPTLYGGIDFSPIIIFILIIFFRTFVINSLTQIASYLTCN